MTETITSIDWYGIFKISGIYIAYFVFYAMLIQTTIVATINGISSIFYKDDKGSPIAEITAASLMWALYIVMNTQV